MADNKSIQYVALLLPSIRGITCNNSKQVNFISLNQRDHSHIHMAYAQLNYSQNNDIIHMQMQFVLDKNHHAMSIFTFLPLSGHVTPLITVCQLFIYFVTCILIIVYPNMSSFIQIIQKEIYKIYLNQTIMDFNRIRN